MDVYLYIYIFIIIFWHLWNAWNIGTIWSNKKMVWSNEPYEVSIVLATSPTFSRSLMQRPSNFLRLGHMVLRGQAARVCGFILCPLRSSSKNRLIIHQKVPSNLMKQLRYQVFWHKHWDPLWLANSITIRRFGNSGSSGFLVTCGLSLNTGPNRCRKSITLENNALTNGVLKKICRWPIGNHFLLQKPLKTFPNYPKLPGTFRF